MSFTILIPFLYIKDLFLTALTIRFPQEYLKVEPFWMFLTNTQKWSTITNEALKELVNKYGEQDPHIRTLINGRDINFSFNKSQIHSADMPINGIAGCRNFDGKTICERKLQNSYYYGTSLKKIFEVHPNYIISLINSGKISISRKACDELKEFSYYTKLLKAIEEKEIEKEEEERERQMQDDAFWDDYDNNYNANRGYQDAFDGDPDAEWNVY